MGQQLHRSDRCLNKTISKCRVWRQPNDLRPPRTSVGKLCKLINCTPCQHLRLNPTGTTRSTSTASCSAGTQTRHLVLVPVREPGVHRRAGEDNDFRPLDNPTVLESSSSSSSRGGARSTVNRLASETAWRWERQRPRATLYGPELNLTVSSASRGSSGTQKTAPA